MEKKPLTLSRLFGKLAKCTSVALLICFSVFAFAIPAGAQTGFGIGGGSLWKLVSGALQPLTSTWTIGSPSTRVAAVYTSLLDATAVTIGGASNGNITAPSFTATSTIADSSFNRLTWVNATGTNTTSTNLFANNFVFGSASGTSVTSSRLALDYGTAADPALQWNGSGGKYGAYMNGPTQLELVAAGSARFLIGQSENTSAGTLRPLSDGVVSLGLLTARWGTVNAVNVSSTNATTTNMNIANNLVVSAIGGLGSITIGQTVLSPTQFISTYSGSAIILAGFLRSSAGTYAGNPTMFDNSDATKGWGWDNSLGLLYGRNGDRYWSMSKVIANHSTTTMSTDVLKIGQNTSSTIFYIGAGDGCGRLTVTTSSTWPTAMTPVPVANCN